MPCSHNLCDSASHTPHSPEAWTYGSNRPSLAAKHRTRPILLGLRLGRNKELDKSFFVFIPQRNLISTPSNMGLFLSMAAREGLWVPRSMLRGNEEYDSLHHMNYESIATGEGGLQVGPIHSQESTKLSARDVSLHWMCKFPSSIRDLQVTFSTRDKQVTSPWDVPSLGCASFLLRMGCASLHFRTATESTFKFLILPSFRYM